MNGQLAACDGPDCGGGGCRSCMVRRVSVCASLTEDELALLESLAHPTHFAAGETLFAQGREAHSVYNVTAGAVRLYNLLADGRRQVVGFALPGDFLGLAMRDAYGFSADAIGAVSVCAFSRAAYTALVDAKPHLLKRLHEFATHELTLAHEQMMLLGRRTAEEKLICFLHGMQQRWARIGKPSVTVPLPMTRQDIADFLGLTIETVSRTFTRLAREKTILIVPGGVRVMNAERMSAVAA
ncbi:cyclic nucleotide-binding domain-containing protein [Bosea sp. (in: a-proteobacteria)]|uniref:Crp/Fnr family transcriptional regulator n=1 Tax=Bosea sp. (in: a-proteobacteria) TaxID=1871050 RepID=UPI0026216679|nr:cyclic nucleotide-binding domain-containing protein [Bosea sp. (in: a-proteobacteria)]MCO5090693.1 helix-turn-helix domain-containing protein [Bosea sp. (in: a-proteobacteria)]